MSGENQITNILELAPAFLQDDPSAAYLQAMSTCLFLLSGKSDSATRAGVPGYGDPSAIPLQAADRVLVQGPAESNGSFIARMPDFLDAWARAGSRVAVLEQLQAYLTNLQPGVVATFPDVTIVGGNTSATRWDTLTFAAPQGAPPSRSLIAPQNFNWDGTAHNSRAWLVLFQHLVPTGVSGSGATVASVGSSGVAGVTSGFATLTGLANLTEPQQYITITGAAHAANNGTFQITSIISSTSCIIANTKAVSGDTFAWSLGVYPWIAPAPVWGSPNFVWGAGSWGVSASHFVIESVRALLRTWKSASTYYPRIIVSFGGGDGTASNEFSPLSAQGAGNPDGTWGDIGKLSGGAWVPAKQPLNAFTAFCDGTGTAVQCYEKWQT